MEHIRLVIQRTFNGLEVIYTSPGFDINNQQFKSSLSDERKDASQIAHRSNVFSINREKNHKVYSFIDTSAVDIEKREGFYAIRLFLNLNKEIQDVQNVLLKISEKFTDFVNSNSLSNQNYDDILATVKLQDEKKPISINYTIEGSYYLYIDELENLNNLKQKDASFFVKKLYLFDKNKAQEESVAKQFGMKSLLEIQSKIIDVNVDDSFNNLASITINNQRLKLPIEKNLNLLLLNQIL